MRDSNEKKHKSMAKVSSADKKTVRNMSKTNDFDANYIKPS